MFIIGIIILCDKYVLCTCKRKVVKKRDCAILATIVQDLSIDIDICMRLKFLLSCAIVSR